MIIINKSKNMYRGTISLYDILSFNIFYICFAVQFPKWNFLFNTALKLNVNENCTEQSTLA